MAGKVFISPCYVRGYVATGSLPSQGQVGFVLHKTTKTIEIRNPNIEIQEKVSAKKVLSHKELLRGNRVWTFPYIRRTCADGAKIALLLGSGLALSCLGVRDKKIIKSKIFGFR
jgi:hypothetical protein